jgi:glycosyltransferase involved in cell wall biosynthesis
MNSVITVITVVYNDVASIGKTISNVINQTYKNIEYIVIDGGSSDGTVDVIRKYENRISFWSSEADRGIYDAMNKGVSRANGEWVIFLNAGDTFCHNGILSEIGFNPEYDVIYGKTNVIHKNGNYVLSPRPVKYLSKRMIFCHQSVFVKRNLLLAYPFDLKYKIASDYNLFYTLYTHNCKFQQEDRCIADFDAEEGVSARSAVRLLKENLSINKNFNAYITALIRYKTGRFIKLLIPSFYLTFFKLKNRYVIWMNRV